MSASTQTVPAKQDRKSTAQTRHSKKKPLRTTVTLNAATAEIVENFKAATGLSTSRAIDELILRSEPRKSRIKMVNGRAVFDLPIEKGSITTEHILQLEDEPW
jgi:hypothetical protein